MTSPVSPSPAGGTTLPERLVARASALLARRGTTRRSFLTKTAIVGSAVVANPVTYILRPGTAYASVCGPGASCSSGWTAFCCTVNGGRNTCPSGSFVAGWWKADNAAYCCGAARYIIDCNATCPTRCTCRCADAGTCDQRKTCCNQFRYGQCHQEISCYGPVVCRVATCTPPWQYDPSCTRTSATDNRTVDHGAPCLGTDCGPPPLDPGAYAPFPSTAALVTQQYQDFDGRKPTDYELYIWVAGLNNRQDTAASFIRKVEENTEFQRVMPPIIRLYLGFFRRIPDAPGVLYWADRVRKGVPLDEIARLFATSPEFQSTYGSLDDDAFVDLVYHNVLSRDPDADGKAYWVGLLGNGKITRGQLMRLFVESDEFRFFHHWMTQVIAVYVSMLRRAPVQGDIDYWQQVVSSAGKVDALAEAIRLTGEYWTRFG